MYPNSPFVAPAAPRRVPDLPPVSGKPQPPARAAAGAPEPTRLPAETTDPATNGSR